jgi:single-strand DNA-binding protein
MGNLTRDPQLSYTPNNTAVCKVGIATNRVFTDANNEKREEVCFVDCTIFGKSAETFNQYMNKGRSVLLEGRLHYHQWTTPEGEKRSKHEVIVESFKFVGARPGAEGGGPPPARTGGYAAPRTAAAGAPASAPHPPVEDFDVPPPTSDGDIPF